MCRIKINYILVIIAVISTMAFAQYPFPYTVDSNTLHLYHFDSDAVDSAGTLDLTFNDGAALGTSYSGFANAVNTYDGGSGSGPYAGSSSSKVHVSDLVGSDGAFTFEAIVNPQVEQGAIPNHMEIICLEDSDATAGQRGFQLRINDDGSLRFQTLAGVVSSFDAAISYNAGSWYHVAVTYNGQENTADNLKLFWTEIDAFTSVQEVGSFQLTADLDMDVDGYFSVGNELRPTAYSENFEGLIDEVRISSIQRVSSEMLYSADSDTLHYYRFEGTAKDSIRTNSIDLAGGNGVTLSASVDGYGKSLNTYNGIAGEAPYVGDNSTKRQISELVGSDGAFTFEAWVKPMMNSSELPNHMQILSQEDDDNSAQERGFHFRITDDGSYLQFSSLAGTYYSFSAPISFVPDTWYHVAVTYNGAENTADNLKMYWSKLFAHTTVQEVGSFQAPSDLQPSTDGYLCIANELRTTGGYSENFEGLIDEVRISRVARIGSDFMYLSNDGLASITVQPDSFTVNTDETAVLECSFAVETLGTVQWYKQAGSEVVPVDPADSRITVIQDYDSENMIYTSSLIFVNCVVSDLGDYYLAVSNDSGDFVYSDHALLTVQGLWAHWTLDEADYTASYYSEKIAGKNAMVESVPSFVIGADREQNGAVNISSNSGWAVVYADNPLELSGAFTLSFWANWQSQENSSDLLIDSGIGTEISVADGLHAVTWQHICAVFNGSICTLYIDGVPAAVSDWALPGGMSAEINIGSAGLGSEAFNGQLDDIRIYNYAMDVTEIAELRFDFAGFGSCINPYGISVDWSGPDNEPDCIIDVYDLTAFVNHFLDSDSQYDISGPLYQPDGVVSMFDFAQFAALWLDCGLYPDCSI